MGAARSVLGPLALVLVAFAIRGLSITRQSLWLDEVYSLIFVQGNLGEAWRNGIFPEQNPHAPAYYLLLWGWLKGGGVNDLAARWLSLMCGIASVAALWRLARDWGSFRAANIAATLMALSPFAIWYAQEARQYSLYLLLALLATLLLSRLARARPARREAGLWVAYALCAVAMAYSHFFGIFTLPAHAALAIILRRAGRLRALAVFTAIAIACIPIPLALLGSGRTFDSADVTRRFVGLGEMIELSVHEFMLRKPLFEDARRYAYLAPIFGLWLLGWAQALKRSRPLGAFIGALALGPLLTFLPVSLVVSVFSPKYSLAVYPILLIGIAEGLDTIFRFLQRLARSPANPRPRIQAVVSAALLAALLFPGGLAHARDLTDPQAQREQWKWVASYLERVASPGDKIVVFADYAQPVLAHYYTGPADMIRFLDEPIAPEAFFDKIQQGEYKNLWLVLAHDRVAKQNHRLVEVATARYPWAYAQYPNSGFIRVLGYNLRYKHKTLPADAIPASATFDNGVKLVGYIVDQSRLPATESVSHPPSNWIHVTAFWTRDAGMDPTAPHARPFVRLVGPEGEWGGDLARIPSVFEFDPPKGWADGVIIESHHDVNLNPVTPPNRYPLVIGLVRDDGSRLNVRGATEQSARLTEIEIVPR